MKAIDQDGNTFEIKLETKIESPFLVNGVEVMTKKDQDLMVEVGRQLAERIDQRLTDLLMGITQDDYDREHKGDWSLLEDGEQ